jgi:kynureninase
MTDFKHTKSQFYLPPGVIYLDGNSLGPLPLSVHARLEHTLRAEWGEMLIRGWNQAGWMEQPGALGDRLAPLIGAEAGAVMLGDTLSLKVFQALSAALRLNPKRRVVLSDRGNFPSDLYMTQGLLSALGDNYALRLVEPEEVAGALSEDVAVVLLTEVDFRSGRLHDMHGLTQAAHAHGVLSVWDLAHSAGAIPVALKDARADFAVGCTYKYLNAGPGAPAFIYVAPRHHGDVEPLLSGWLGHASPFEFGLQYAPGAGMERMRVGTPPVLGLAALDAALDIWDDVDMHDVRARSIELSELFIDEVERRCPDLELASPRDPHARGSQVSFRFEHGYACMQALIEQGVIGDFRAPDGMRFGFTPLYIDHHDVLQAVAILEAILRDRLWDAPRFHLRAAVT